MFRTIAECDKALKRLEMEREHILNVRKFIEENGPQLFIPRRQKGNRNRVIQIVMDNPGIDGQTVRKILQDEGFDVSKRQAQSALSRSAAANEIENRGKHGLGARWYIVEPPKDSTN